METLLVQQTTHQDSSMNETVAGTASEILDFIEKEVDMGFFNQHSFEVKEGIVINDSCQRISKCGCNCNHCTWIS